MATITRFKAGFYTHIEGAGLAVCQYPAQTFLIQTHQHTWFWDISYASHFFDTTRGVFALYREFTLVSYQETESIVSQLESIGITPDQLSGIILSHFHGEHIAGAKDVPGAPFFCSGEGWTQLRTKRSILALQRGFVLGLLPNDFESQTQFVEGFEKITLPTALAPFTKGYLLLGSHKEVILIPLLGLAENHIGTFVFTDKGWQFIASNAGWSTDNYRDLMMPSRLANQIMTDHHTFEKARHQIHLLDKNKIKIHLTHEETL